MNECLLVDNFLDKNDLKKVLNDIKNHKDCFVVDENRQDVADYKRWFIDDTYNGRRNDSVILKIMNRNLFGKKLLKKIAKIHVYGFQAVPCSTKHETQITKYSKGDKYGWHDDVSHGRFLNFVLYMSECEGGELAISKDSKKTVDYIVKPKISRLVTFPSNLLHKVNTVKTGERITINGHIGYKI